MTVAATPARLPRTKSTAARVVMCSNTTRSAGSALGERRQHALDEARLAIEHVDRRVGDLAVHLEHHAELGHAREHRLDAAYVGDAVLRVGGGAGRVELAAVHDSRSPGRARSRPAASCR